MRFLFFWSLGCTLGAMFSVEAAAWAGLVVAALSLWAPARLRRGGLTLAVALLGASWGAQRAPSPSPLVSPDGLVEVRGTVARSVRVSERDVRTTLNDVSVDGRPMTTPLSLRARGACAWPVGALYKGLAELRSHGSVGAQRRLFGRARSEGPIDASCAAERRPHERISLPSADSAALLRALSLGDRTGVTPSIREVFIDTGTMHLLAISGLHLGVVAWGLYRTLLALLCLLGPGAWTRDNPRFAAALAILGVWGVVSQIQTTDATLRAAWAVSVILLGLCAGRRADPSRVLLLAASAVVTLDPLAPLGASFQLSFIAVWAILSVAPHVSALRERLESPGAVSLPTMRRVGRWLLELGMVNFAASAATAPLGLSWFGQLSWVGPLVNLVATPWVALVVVPSMVVWLFISGLWPPLGTLTAPILGGVLGLLLDGLEVWADLAGSAQWVAVPPLAGLAMSLGVIGLLGRGWRRLGGVALVAIGLVGAFMATAPPQAWRVTALDVGHGDAVLLEGPQGQTALIDAGGHPRHPRLGAEQARRRLLPQLARLGVARLDLLVITHGDLDHVGGAAELARRIPVEEVWVSGCPQRRAVHALARAVISRRGRVVRVSSGPPRIWGEGSLEVLWPRSGAPCSRTENDRSVVLRLETPGGSALLMGDASAEVERSLLELAPHRLRADVLKVGHHGSETSSDARFLAATGSRIGLVSGPGRHRGFLPSETILTRLRQAGLSVWITGRDGTGQILLDPTLERQVTRIRTP